jgi:IS5 family transposase
LWDAILPEQCRGLPPGLAEVDQLLDDRRFFAPFRFCFDSRYGRPSIPIETYIRMMVLKYRYGLGFESLCREVADSIAWRRFCRIPLDQRVPHPSTLEKITVRAGERTIAELNEELVVKAAEAKLVKTDRVRADTTVVPANVCYPSDSGLLDRGVARLSRLAGQLKDMGLAKRTRFRDRTRAMRRRGHAIGTWLRRRTDEAKDEVLALTGDMAAIAEATLADAVAVARNARRKLESMAPAVSGQAVRTLIDLEEMIGRVGQVIDQTRARLAGTMPDGATRIVSLHDPDARPIRKGRLGKPVEFGYKAQVVDNADGVVVDYHIMMGNPADAPLLAPAIKRIMARLGRVPRAVTADRGYGEAPVEAELEELGVKQVAIPRKGRPSAARQKLQRSGRFAKLVKWRTGCEGRIASLKRGAGWDRTLMDGLDGTTMWCGWGILTHNSFKIAALLNADVPTPHGRDQRRPPPPVGHGPPPGPPCAA